MKEKIILFFKGMIIGMSMIMPGISGGTLAISLGVYEKIINTISHFFTNFKENLKFVINLGLGVIASVILCVLVLNYTFEHFPIPTILFFIGLILGSIPMIFSEVKKKINISNIILFLLGIGLLIGITFLKGSGNVSLTPITVNKEISLLFVGFIAAGTLIIPGISGSFMLMVLGYYEPLLKIVSETIKFQNLSTNIIILIPAGIGIILGVVVFSKLIEFLFKKYKTQTYFVILGFLVASIIQIGSTLFSYSTSILSIVIGVILFIFGAFLSLKVFKN